ncbi:MAG: PucR family transcriptional regulator [Patescibacteria group bacterium]
MPLTLREALTVAEPLRRSRVVAGSRGLDNVVRFINVMEVPDILDWVHPGELLVTTMYPLRDDAAAVEDLIPKLAGKGLAGLAITPGYIGRITSGMIEAADRLDFPLIELPRNVSFSEIILPLTGKILDLQAQELIQSENIHREFIDLVLGGGGYPEIAQGLAHLLQRPVSIVDRFRRILANGLLLGEALPLARQARDEATGDTYLTEDFRPDSQKEIPGSAARLEAVAAGSAEGDLHLVYPIKVGAQTLGRIIVWGPLAHPPQPADLVAIEHGATVTALKMMEERSVREMEQRFRNEILEGLLSDHPASHDRAVRQLRETGQSLDPPFALVMVSPDLPPGTLLMRAERAEQANVSSSLHLATRYIRSVWPGAAFWHQGPRLVVFLPLQAGRAPAAKAFLTDELRKVCRRIEAENAPYTVSMGISGPAAELGRFREAYDCARQSLEMGRTLRDEARSLVTHYEDLGIFRVTSLSASPSSMERFCRETIGPLLEYDRQYGADLVRTLRIYLEQNQNAARAAKALHIHYNTLRYRLEKIKELLGDVLANPQERLVLEVALQIRNLTAPA